jgi:molecular chaperone DnaK
VKTSTCAGRLSGRRVQEGTGHRPAKGDKLALQRLKEAAEKAKIELSSSTQTEINLPFITADAVRSEAPDDEADPRQVRSLVDDLVKRTVEPMQGGLKDAGLKAGEIDEVVLVGGMTRMPKGQETVKSSSARSRTRA